MRCRWGVPSLLAAAITGSLVLAGLGRAQAQCTGTNTTFGTTGSIGIGTSSPQRPLHICSSGGEAFPLRLERNGVGAFEFTVSQVMTGSVSDFVLDGTGLSQGFIIRSRNAAGAAISAIGVDRDGRIGIGTAAPIRRFHISTPATEAFPFRLERQTVGAFDITVSAVMSNSNSDLIIDGSDVSQGVGLRPPKPGRAAINALGTDRDGR